MTGVTRISLPPCLPYVHTACLPSKPRTISMRQKPQHINWGRRIRPLLFLKLTQQPGPRQDAPEMRPRPAAFKESPMPTPANGNGNDKANDKANSNEK